MKPIHRAVLVVALLAGSGCFKLDLNLGGKGKGGKDADKPAPSQVPDASAPDQAPTPQAPDAGAADQPAPTQPPAGAATGGSWRDLLTRAAGGTFLDSEHGAVLHAYDTLAHPRKPVELVVKLLSAASLQPIAGVTIAIERGQWLAGRVTTRADGLAVLQWAPPAIGNYTFTARVVAVPDESHKDLLEVSPAPLLVAARDPATRFVVIDLDHTIVDSSFFRVLLDGGKPMADSVAVTRRIAEVYGMIYLTHRPDLLTRKSKDWLTRNGYPSAPLLVSEMKDILDSGRFKTAKLAEVRKVFPGVAIGIGDKPSDAQAYVDNGLTAYLIPHYKDKPKDMREMARQVRALRGEGRLHVVSGWREIEAGIFGGRSFAPKAFADALEKRAAQIEADQRDRDDEDDD